MDIRLVGDIQPGSPKSCRYNPSWIKNRKQIAAINPDLLLVGGDLTRDGNVHRYCCSRLGAGSA